MTDAASVGAGPANIDGYIADSLYPSVYHYLFAPEWTDTVLLRAGKRPPRGLPGADCGTTMLDLGCGDGLGLIASAYADPSSRFIGIDAMPGHVERGRQAAIELGLANVELRCATFGQALEFEPVEAHYVAAQGVLSWVSPQACADLIALIARNLGPGGAATVGYNTMPGWTSRLSFQKIVHTLSRTVAGSPQERFAGGFARTRELPALGAHGVSEHVFEWMDELSLDVPAGYLPHEYLNANWQPLWSLDVIETFADNGLTYTCPAMPQLLRDAFVLKRAQRETLATYDDAATRELVKDHFINEQFRMDVYTGGEASEVARSEAAEALMHSTWLLRRPEEQVEFAIDGRVGKVRFDNLAARAVVERLSRGPASLAEIGEAHDDCTRADLLLAIDALAYDGQVVPVRPRDDSIDCAAFNRWVVAGGVARMGAVMTPFGPVSVGPAVLPSALDDAASRRRLGL
ncbi:hypothetical protein B2G71_10360 [Novosphingobium sp. PC22D]|uniref:class I SAM-dependent methyltransferase n=1 Tax=Novosphingobium sp. PC22D TaxID=1962403 RepID=UPI000BFB11C1|nr:class I SAM-dependent methyltransferase [Novosphingobium sp. PC22D]PEQ12700.1 hypothetical protein B2G71_10360 [Novosphingobium sp. PC22D]